MLPLISIVDSYCMNIRSRGHSDILQTCVQFNVVNVKVVMKWYSDKATSTTKSYRFLQGLSGGCVGVCNGNSICMLVSTFVHFVEYEGKAKRL